MGVAPGAAGVVSPSAELPIRRDVGSSVAPYDPTRFPSGPGTEVTHQLPRGPLKPLPGWHPLRHNCLVRRRLELVARTGFEPVLPA